MNYRSDDDEEFDIAPYEDKLFDAIDRELRKATDSLTDVMQDALGDLSDNLGASNFADSDDPVERFKQTCKDSVADITEQIKNSLMRSIASM